MCMQSMYARMNAYECIRCVHNLHACTCMHSMHAYCGLTHGPRLRQIQHTSNYARVQPRHPFESPVEYPCASMGCARREYPGVYSRVWEVMGWIQAETATLAPTPGPTPSPTPAPTPSPTLAPTHTSSATGC